jgi:hypothetical protein|tara:strand:+ start:211 stop:789 length:579 start_codon:yes stop_codon:yes gene_type:complete
MKKTLILLLLIFFGFTAPSFADDVNDFQIEGMGVGDSLLDYLSEEDINRRSISYPNPKFSETYTDESLETYDDVLIAYKAKDKSRKIYGLRGIIYISFRDCESKKREIVEELKDLFGNSANVYNKNRQRHQADRSGKSFYSATYFDLVNGTVSVVCTDWSEKITIDNKWHDTLDVAINSQELSNFLSNEAYK